LVRFEDRFLKPKLVALNVLLAAIVIAIAWQARARWKEGQALSRETLNVAVKPAPTPPIAPAPQPETPPAVKYEDVAKKNLFAADRNADIVVEAPVVEKPKPMPPLPVSTGVMKLPSGVKAFMADKSGEPTHVVTVNDTIGEFKIVALDEQNVTFEWSGKQITKKIEDLIDRSGNQVASSAPAAAGPNVPPPPPVVQQQSNTNQGQSVELTPTSRACASNETSPEAMRLRPAGTVEDGYRKTVTPSIFGMICRWNKQ
jgi:hypothetical protein